MRYEEGDILKIKDRKYKVIQVDLEPIDDRVLQYRLEGVGHDILARLKPHDDGMTLIDYHKAEPEKLDHEGETSDVE